MTGSRPGPRAAAEGIAGVVGIGGITELRRTALHGLIRATLSDEAQAIGADELSPG